MQRARRSLFYPATYLIGNGLGLIVAPEPLLKLLFSNGNYGDVMPRMAGVVILALGILVVQIIRHRVEAMYLSLVGVRIVLCAGWLGLYVYTRDPFFLVVLGVVGFGMIWTSLGYLRDRRELSAARR